MKTQVATTDSSDVLIYICTPNFPVPIVYKNVQIKNPAIINIKISGNGAFLDSNP
jgi:hypothetical protein